MCVVIQSVAKAIRNGNVKGGLQTEVVKQNLPPHCRIRSISGWYSSYWNAFLLCEKFRCLPPFTANGWWFSLRIFPTIRLRTHNVILVWLDISLRDAKRRLNPIQFVSQILKSSLRLGGLTGLKWAFLYIKHCKIRCNDK